MLTLKSGFCDEYSTARPLWLPDRCGRPPAFIIRSFQTLPSRWRLRGDPFHAGAENRVSDWADMLLLDKAEALAYYDHPFFGKYAAITENHFGKGMVTYEGSVLSDTLQQKVLQRVIEQAQLAGPDQKLPAAVKIKHGMGRTGKPMHYYFNFSAAPAAVTYSYAAGRELLSNQGLAHGASIHLEPWGVAIVEQDKL